VTQIVDKYVWDGESGTYTLKLSYDSQGRVTKQSYDDNGEIDEDTYTYSSGKITASRSDGDQYIATLDASGRVSQITYHYSSYTTIVNVIYDSNGYIQKASTAPGSYSYGGDFTWSGGNITSTKNNGSPSGSGAITYTDKTYTGNLCLEYLTEVIESAGEICIDLQVFGLFGYCGQRCASLPLKVQTIEGSSSYTTNYAYTFNDNGTVKTITASEGTGSSAFTFSY